MIWGYGSGWSMMFWMAFWNLCWLVLLGVALWVLVRWLVRTSSQGKYADMSSRGPSALEILQQRYARGEIDAATFEHMREHLENEREPSLGGEK